MAAECSQRAVLDFLRARGPRVSNAEFMAHFRAAFPEEPRGKAAARERFKGYVDGVAFVKTEGGVKYVCLRKKFRGTKGPPDPAPEPPSSDPDTLGPNRKPPSPDRAPPDQAPAEDEEEPAGASPSSGYGSDSQVRFPRHVSAATILTSRRSDGSAEMGNTGSLWFGSDPGRTRDGGRTVPEITVLKASLVPTEERVSAPPGPLPGPEADPPGPDSDDGGQAETGSLCDSEGAGTPRGSRRHFLRAMMHSSSQVRRSLVLRGSAHLSSRSDGDDASLASCSLEEDRASVTLDPVEHEWMLCASDGEWGGLQQLLSTEPSLILRKDFITGFTCLHWAAKHGNPELLATILNFARRHHVPVSVDVRSSSGYTPLHVATMHNHLEVVKLLVGAYDADVEVRDYSGKKACQYLAQDAGMDIRDIIGERPASEKEDSRDASRWRFSKVLQSNLRLLNSGDCEATDGGVWNGEKLLRRNSSFGRLKPKLQKLRHRTSMLVHSTSFRDKEELDEPRKGSLRSRPKTHFFG